MVKLPKDNAKLAQIEPVSKRPKIVVHNPQPVQEQKFKELLEKTQEDYDDIQERVLRSFFNQYNSLPSEVKNLCFNSTWFQGCKKEIDSKKLVKEIAQIVPPKRKQKHPPKLIQFVQMSKSDRFIYSAFVCGSNMHYYLSSKCDALYTCGFDTHASNKKDYVAYYDTKDNAEMAIVWRVCFGKHERNIFHLPRIQSLFESNDQVTLFSTNYTTAQKYCNGIHQGLCV